MAIFIFLNKTDSFLGVPSIIAKQMISECFPAIAQSDIQAPLPLPEIFPIDQRSLPYSVH